jgi:hypothetical protein
MINHGLRLALLVSLGMLGCGSATPNTADRVRVAEGRPIGSGGSGDGSCNKERACDPNNPHSCDGVFGACTIAHCLPDSNCGKYTCIKAQPFA